MIKLLIAFMVFSCSSWAQTSILPFQGKVGASEEEIEEKVRKRAFAGGQDEENIRVIKEFKSPLRYANLNSIQSSVYEQVLEEIEEKKESGDGESADSGAANQ